MIMLTVKIIVIAIVLYIGALLLYGVNGSDGGTGLIENLINGVSIIIVIGVLFGLSLKIFNKKDDKDSHEE